MEQNKRVDSILFVGIGGGNDVFSGILASLSLKRLGWKWGRADFAGVLSPFHHHTGSLAEMQGVIKINPDSKRFLTRNNYQKEIVFVDNAVALLFKNIPDYKKSGLFGL
ncbi:hypothetical protein L0Y49_01265, partial [bacterium]|nr:hypothetical protein [bacterium]